MPGYNNGHIYPLEFIFCFNSKHKVPIVRVEMEPIGYPGGKRGLILGTMDTGAQTTILDFETANRIGIKNPKRAYNGNKLEPSICYTSTGKPVEYYRHAVLIYVQNNHGQSFNFHLQPGFAKKVKKNFFGMDWTLSLCLAFDHQTVHLLGS